MTQHKTIQSKVLLGMAGLLTVATLLGACSKKDSNTAAGGGASAQSVITLQGAAS